MKKKQNLFRGLTAVSVCLLGIAIGVGTTLNNNAGTVNQVLGIVAKTDTTSTEAVYKTKYTEDGKISAEGATKCLEAAMAHAIRETEEGSVLLFNDGALPLSSSIKNISLFGRASTDPIYVGNSGGPSMEASRTVNFKKAFEDAGYNINGDLYSKYSALSLTRNVNVSGDQKATIAEAPSSFYDTSVRNTYANYKDAAIVILSRLSGEGNDFVHLPENEEENVHSLALHPSEKAMLEEVKSAGFGKVIVLLNSVSPIEIGELKNYGVDACLWIGYPGYYGMPGVVNVLSGKINPSGKTVDLFPANALSSPAMANWGDYSFKDNSTKKYVAELEGIYYGYKYYETRYEDCVLNHGNASSTKGSTSGSWNYANEVNYPYGYGLSYTSFSQEIVNESGTPYSHSDAEKPYKFDADKQEFTFKVKVKNTGSVSGKDVVELYLQQPYTDYDKDKLVEKSSVQIVDFAKTEELAPGAEETVELKVPYSYLASYDSNEAETYILDDGDYYFAIGDDSHDALNNIIQAKGGTDLFDKDGSPVTGNLDKVVSYHIDAFDKTTFSVSQYTGAEVKNQFDDMDINYYYGSTSQKQTYLTRNDWDATYPQSVTDLELLSTVDAAMNATYTKDPNGLSLSDVTYGTYVEGGDNLTLADMVGVEMDTEEGKAKWQKYIEQLSTDELAKSTYDNFGTGSLPSAGKPQATHTEGPIGVLGKYQVGDLGQTTGFAANPVLAASYSKSNMYERGEIEAEEALYAGVCAFFSPGANVHRSPFLGRYYDYFSEDGILTSIIIDNMTSALSSHGMISCMKHCTANEQETNRQGLCTFMTEQRMRQESLKPFEKAMSSNHTLGSMLSYNRLGCTPDQAHKGLITGVIRNEWGFCGMLITDAKGESVESPTIESVMAGTTLFCESNRQPTLKKAIAGGDGDLVKQLQTTAKYNLYAYAHSNLVNGLSSDTVVKDTNAWWQNAIIAVYAVVGTAVGAFAVLYVVSRFMKEKGVVSND